jgi:hypothetical protein
MRVEAKWDNVIDPNGYEVLTALPSGSGKENSLLRWVRFDALAGKDTTARARVAAALKREKKDVHFYDVESGKKIAPHGGSVYFNAHRRKWISIFLQAGGESSYIGEVWYAEADTPVGPWAYARKVATHNKYSFYNPKQHPYFDQDGGRVIFFEGTYTYTFSGSSENATPRYDYNQVMYRLSLDDPRLVLPVAVYRASDGRNGTEYVLHDAVASAGKWDSIESVAFYAIEPGRAHGDLVAVYAAKTAGDASLTTEPPASSQSPLFYALPAFEAQTTDACVVPLYEYRRGGSGERLYSTEPPLNNEGWTRGDKPLCRVWKAPQGPLLIDGLAKPVGW